MHWCNISDTTIELSLLSVSFICRFFSSLNSVSALSVLVFWSCSGYSLSSLIRLDHEIKLVAGYQHITSTTKRHLGFVNSWKLVSETVVLAVNLGKVIDFWLFDDSLNLVYLLSIFSGAFSSHCIFMFHI